MESRSSWELVQKEIHDCDACRGEARVARDIRQQTPAPTVRVVLLLVGVAPPYEADVSARTVANSATSDPEDNLRLFIEDTLAERWDSLVAKGMFFIHAVKCAIVPDTESFQNPPNPVVDRCSPIGFVPEFQLLSPPRVVTLGGAARRAVLQHPAVIVPSGVSVSRKLSVLQNSWPDGIPCRLEDKPFVLYPAPFPRSAVAKNGARAVIKRAARLAELIIC